MAYNKMTETMNCDKCKQEMKEENFWNHQHNEYTTIDYEKHYNDTQNS